MGTRYGGALGTAVLPITAEHGLGGDIWSDRDPGDKDTVCTAWGAWHRVPGIGDRVGCSGPSGHHSKACLLWDDWDRVPKTGCQGILGMSRMGCLHGLG